MPHTQQSSMEGWEKDFRGSLIGLQLIHEGRLSDADIEVLSDWMNVKCEKRLESERLKEREEVMKNVGLLRQWLNEERITDTKRLVTNDEIIHWLALTKDSEK